MNRFQTASLKCKMLRRQRFAPAVGALDAAQQRLLTRYVEAWELRDVDALVAMLTEEASFSMPPFPTWFVGRPAITEVLRGRVFADGRKFRLIPTHAGGQPAFAVYKKEQCEERFEPHGIQLVWLGTDAILSVITFQKARLVTAFGLPAEVALRG